MNVSVFGESHGDEIGAVLSGFPAGFEVDTEYIATQLKRRAGGNSAVSTPRHETDDFRIISGVFEGKTTGAPICVIIPNTNTRSDDYSDIKHKMRPNHSDYAAFVKYGGHNDYRGGGHFSGRITAPIVALGAIAKQYLAQNGIEINAYISRIGNIDNDIASVNGSDNLTDEMTAEIISAKNDNNSVGGSIRVLATDVPAGIGKPFWDSVESVLSKLFFSIPAVKAVEFGAGCGFASMLGSEANDQMSINDGNVTFASNNCGGILGGITNGMPINANITFKPTPSIGKAQNTISTLDMTDTTLETRGRHDPCIVPRAVVVVEAMMALGIMDLL